MSLLNCRVLISEISYNLNTVSVKSWFSKPLDNSNQNLFSYPWSHCNFLYFPLRFLNNKMARKPKAQNEV